MGGACLPKEAPLYEMVTEMDEGPYKFKKHVR